MKIVLSLIIGLLLGAAAGIYFAKKYYEPAPQPTVSSTVLRDQLKQVLELTTVKTDYSLDYNEMYDDTYRANLFDRQIQMRLNGTAHFGYDLSNCEITFDEKNKKVRVVIPTDAKLLSFEHDVEIVGASSGWLTTLSWQDYLYALRKAKYKLLEQAYKDSDSYKACWQQREKISDAIKHLCIGSGWQIEEPSPVKL